MRLNTQAIWTNLKASPLKTHDLRTKAISICTTRLLHLRLFYTYKNRGIRFLFDGVWGFSGEGSNSLGLGCLGYVALIKHVWDIVS